jgi:hypothetical protein
MSALNWTSVLGHQLDASSTGLDGHRVSIDPCPSSESGALCSGLSARQQSDRRGGAAHPSRPALALSQTALQDAARRQDAEAAIVQALVAAVVASFQRDPIATDGAARGTAGKPNAGSDEPQPTSGPAANVMQADREFARAHKSALLTCIRHVSAQAGRPS